MDDPVRVLVVDDQPAFRALVAIWLQEGLRVQVEILEAGSLAQMRAVARAAAPDVVLMDQRLPDGAGLDGARELLAQDPEATVLLLTGMADHALDEEAERVGVTDFLVKHEVDGPLLARAVRYALRRREDARNLRRSEARYRDLVDALPDTGVLVYDAQLRFVMAAGAALVAAGWNPDELVGRDAVAVLEGSGRGDLVEYYRAALAGAGATIEFTSPAGRSYRTHFCPLTGGPTPEAMVVTFDITEERRRAVELQRAQAIARIGSWSWDPATREGRWSPELFRLLGLEPAAGASRVETILDTVEDPGQRAGIETAWAAVLAGAPEREVEFTTRRDDGARRILLSRFRGVAGPDGGIVRLEGVTRDVTEQRVAEARREAVQRDLRDAQERFRMAFESAASGVVLVAPDATVLEVNEAAARMLGRTVQELVGADGLSFVVPEEREVAALEMAAALAGGERHGRYDRGFLHADGSTVHTLMTTALAFDDDGAPRYFTLQMIDQTEQVRARADRDRAVGLGGPEPAPTG